ncbi:MAG: hypothetical protein M3Y50_05050 [Acidobacteriota bacterium]|nr:hypothetical protein [Acidobacteriota bacterium]
MFDLRPPSQAPPNSGSRRRKRVLALLYVTHLTFFSPLPGLSGQAIVTSSSGGGAVSATTTSAPAGILPLQRGINASLASTSQHDPSNGWSSILTPDLAYRFTRSLSADASIPVYDYIHIQVNHGTGAKPVYKDTTKHAALGDTALSAHLDLHPSRFDYTLSGSLGLPTGKPAYGLGAGQPTYNVINHFEKGLGMFTPDIELGIGDASSLLTRRVRKNYISVGALASFQAGSSMDLPYSMVFEADAYEQLPVANSNTYTTTGRGKKKTTTATSNGPSEDNGFITSLDVPLVSHLTLSGFYNRSLRLHNDVAGFTLTFLLRAPPTELASVK